MNEGMEPTMHRQVAPQPGREIHVRGAHGHRAHTGMGGNGGSLPVRFGQGLAMACADSVPGVSGSTVAFILGFYDTFVSSLHALVTGDRARIADALKFLVKLGCGWIVGMALAATVLSGLLSTHIYFMSSLFVGLTLAAIPILARQERASFQPKASHAAFVLIGFAVVAGVSLLRPLTGFSPAVDFAALGLVDGAYIVFAGVAGISAMLLPGISGSTVLLILGVYLPAMTAAGQLAHGDASGVLGIALLVAGVLIGLVTTVRLVKRAAERHRSQLMYLVMGMLAGSLVAISFAPATMAHPLPPLSSATFSVVGMLVGVGILFALEWLAARVGGRPSCKE
ncbi:MAG: DUF368 domain-containing protein [Eggerthellaceae bacterium]|jgi:putative membrane protein